MTQSNIEWMQSKAEEMLHNQIEQIARSAYPASDFAEGVLEAFYAIGLIGDLGREYWEAELRLAVVHRRDELREAKCRALFDAPVVVNGELIAGGEKFRN